MESHLAPVEQPISQSPHELHLCNLTAFGVGLGFNPNIFAESYIFRVNGLHLFRGIGLISIRSSSSSNSGVRSSPNSLKPLSALTMLPQDITVEPPVVIPLTSTRSLFDRNASMYGNIRFIVFSSPNIPSLRSGSVRVRYRVNGLNGFPASNIVTS